MNTTEAIKPVAPYVGGKHLLAKTLLPRLEAIPHTGYAEPFVGMGGVFLRRPERAKSEVINDYNREVANFFRILQRHYIAFMEMMRFQITTRAEFQRLTQTHPDTLTDLERAARFLYLQRTAFGGKPCGQRRSCASCARGIPYIPVHSSPVCSCTGDIPYIPVHNFAATRTHPARFDVTKLAPMLEDLHSRLTRVVIECLPYQDFIRRYDSDKTLFYLDPPYYRCEHDYGKDLFHRNDFAVLASLLTEIQGKFVLSLNDAPDVRELFKGFQIEAVKTRYTVQRGKNKDVGEVLISSP